MGTDVAQRDQDQSLAASTPLLPSRVTSQLDDEASYRRVSGPPFLEWHPPDLTIEEARAAVVALEAALVPARPEEIAMRVLRLSAHFGEAKRSQDAWRVIAEDFAEDLAPYPPDIISAGITAHRQNSIYWPKPKELRDLMHPLLARRRSHLRWLRQFVEREGQEAA